MSDKAGYTPQMVDLGSILTRERPKLRKPRRKQPAEPKAKKEAVSTAELAPCTCPDFCERDHDTD
jgi:hypothetical protein